MSAAHLSVPLQGSIPSPSTGGDDTISDEEEARKRRELLARRPSYRRILNDLSDVERDLKQEVQEVGSNSEDGTDNQVYGNNNANGDSNNILQQYSHEHNTSLLVPGTSELLGLPPVVSNGPLSLTGSSCFSSLMPSGYVSSSPSPHGLSCNSPLGDGPVTEEAGRKRQIRLLKNREAAKECRRKKKEYVKCLENRVAVLENQNKALIEELKTLKELYCRKGD